MTGKFIALEGGEGSGKSTLARRLWVHFSDKMILTREPGGSPLGEKIRSIALSEDARDAPVDTLFSLMWAARFSHEHSIIAPNMKAGKLVVTDRYDASTYAYQIGGQRAHHLELLFWDFRKLLSNHGIPMLYLFLDGDPETLVGRAFGRGGTNHFDERDMPFHTRVRNGFTVFFERIESTSGYSRVHVLDATLSQDDIFEQAVKAIEAL